MKNRHLLGFDNPRKALLTTIKEAVDNSLDACEELRVAPELKIKITKTSETEDRYKIVIEDNGPGIVKEQIPNIFGKLLYGSKFHSMKCTRGQQGIGISAAAMYGQLTTGKPINIISKTGPKRNANFYSLQINTKTNEPEIMQEEVVDWEEKQHGTKISIEMEAIYQKGMRSVDEYLEYTAIANPHATIIYQAPGEEPKTFERATKELPVEPKEIKPHPYGIELGMLIKMLKETKSLTLQSFLTSEFSSVSPKVAKEICEKSKLYEKARPSRIARQEADNLFKIIKNVKIRAPPTNCLVPIGEELIKKGLQKEIDAEFYVASSRPPSVYRGNPFKIEIGIAYGGNIPVEGTAKLIRFANRVPLQYQQGACAITKSVMQTSWRGYGLSQSKGSLPQGPLVIIIHIASVWVPFTSESKEAIAHYPEIIKELKLALQEAGRKLGGYIRKRKASEYESKKRSYIEKYIPHIGAALKEILNLKDNQEININEKLKEILERSRK